jgi:hypothetical protein
MAVRKKQKGGLRPEWRPLISAPQSSQLQANSSSRPIPAHHIATSSQTFAVNFPPFSSKSARGHADVDRHFGSWRTGDTLTGKLVSDL